MTDAGFKTGSPFWRAVSLALRLAKAAAYFPLVALVIGLHASPVSPYLRVSGSECRYIGARGFWAAPLEQCPAWTLRQHFALWY